MIKGTLKSGFEFEYDESVANDMRFLDDLAKVTVDGNPLYAPRVTEKLIGVEQKEALYKHLEKDGRVSAEDFAEALGEIMEASNKVKN